MSQSTSFVGSTKRGSQGWGRDSLALCWWRSRRGVGSPNSKSAAAPNTYSDSRGTVPEGAGGVPGQLDPRPVPMLIRSHDPGHSRRLARPRRDVPFVAAREAGQTSRSRPRRREGRGACERGRQLPQLVESPAVPCVLVDWSKDHEPVSRSPVRSRRRWSFHAITSLFSFEALRFLYGKDRRPIQATGCPRPDLQRTLRTESDNALSRLVHG